MRPVLLSTTDTRGGACRGAYKLFTALDAMDRVSPRLLVQHQYGDHPRVHQLRLPLRSLRKEIDLSPLRRGYPDRVRTPFSVHRVPGRVARQAMALAPDLVHLHWVSAGFVRVEALRAMDVPLVWTFRDMWPMTGGCHYAGSCQGYLEQCGACPILRSHREDDLSRDIFRRKQAAWKGLEIHVAAPCRWMAECARQSALFRHAQVTVIPNGVNVEDFAPMDMAEARQALGLPPAGRVLLFGADHALADPRKGYAFLKEALHRLRSKFAPEELTLLVFGADASGEELGFPVRSLGRVEDDQLLRTAYCAANLFCAPSLEENMANTVLESLACGTPVAAFDIGGMPDMITPGLNGGLARPGDGESLARTMETLLLGPAMREACRERAEKTFDIRVVARQYAELYQAVVER